MSRRPEASRIFIMGCSPRPRSRLLRASRLDQCNEKIDRGYRHSAGSIACRITHLVYDISRRFFLTNVALILCFAVSCHPSRATDVTGQQSPIIANDDPPPSDFWGQVRDLGGLRSALANKGVELTFTYYGETLANPAGGVSQGAIYDGRLGAIIDADLAKLLGWSGATFHASIHQIQGQGLSAGYVQNLMTVSGIEALATTRLFNLWVEQKYGDKASVRVGQFSAAQEFIVSQNANLFVNSTFGWPVITAQDLPSGGPAYPEATPGIRLKFTPNDQITLMAAVFNGDPAGPGTGDPVARDPYGLAFRVNDPPLIIAEIDYAYNQASTEGNGNQEGSPNQTSKRKSSNNGPQSFGLPGTIRFGSWYHTGEFADQRFGAQGLSLSNPLSTGQPLEHRGDLGIYAVIDQMLWRLPGSSDQGLSGFMRTSASPSDRNLIDFYADAGLTYKGLIAGRPDDVFGFGVGFARISPQASAADQDMISFTGNPIPIRDYEAVVELTYQAQLTKNWSMQPDFQYIVHPGGNVPNPLDPKGVSPIPNAVVVGVRTVMKF
jgi:porin